MKNIVSLVLVIGLLAGCNSQQREGSGVKISGSVEQFVQGSFLHLEQITETGASAIDTIEVKSDGTFSEYVTIPEPAFYRLNFNNRQIVTLILKGDEEEVTVHANGNDPRGFIEVSGSYDTEYKNQMEDIMKTFQKDRAKFQQLQVQARNNGDAAAFNAAANDMAGVGIKAEDQLKRLIRKATPSLAALYGIQMIDADRNYAFVDSVSTVLVTELPNNFHVRALAAQMETKKTLTIGSPAPDITLPNPEGEVVSLSSLKGKYVLIDFWAAWCRPCRAENPNVVRVYNEYADRNFEILGVSLDKTRNAWLGAIEQDGLPWLHVSDLKFWQSEAARTYQISAIPATYLIDPEGNIIAKNLRGASLEAKLREIFG